MRVSICLVSALVTLVAGAGMRKCSSAIPPDVTDKVEITPCCDLKRGTNITVTIKFSTDHVIKELTTSVHGRIFGIPLPFAGVNGRSACSNVYEAANPDEPAPCPLMPGVQYMYRQTIPILNVYPRLRVTVKWSLVENRKDIFCFELPTRII